jgi:excisionase family DNA binding protein
MKFQVTSSEAGRDPMSGCQPARLLTIDQARQLLQVSRATLYRLLEEGSLSSVYVRRSRRITTEAVDSYIRSLTAEKKRAL